MTSLGTIFSRSSKPSAIRVSTLLTASRKRKAWLATLRSTERSEDFVQFDFTGTAVQFLAPQGPGGATIEVFLDGESVRHVNQYHPMPLGTAPLLTLTGLSAGRHTLCLVKKRGAWMNVEAFRVFNPAGK